MFYYKALITEVVEGKVSTVDEVKKDINNNEIDYKSDIIVALDDIQDPGNLGTILRTVDSVRIKPNFGVKRHSRCI